MSTVGNPLQLQYSQGLELISTAEGFKSFSHLCTPASRKPGTKSRVVWKAKGETEPNSARCEPCAAAIV
jgi:hypothetical protein